MSNFKAFWLEHQQIVDRSNAKMHPITSNLTFIQLYACVSTSYTNYY